MQSDNERHESLLELLRHAIASNGKRLGQELLRTHHPADVVEALDELNDEDRTRLIEQIPLEIRAWLLPFAAKAQVKQLFAGCTDADVADILDKMPADDAVDLLERMDSRRSESVLSEAGWELQSTLRTLLKSKPESAGALMTTEFLKLDGELTVGQAIEAIEKVAADVETPYAVYIVTKEGHLRGVVSLRELLAAAEDEVLEELMRREPVVAHVDDDQEEVTQKIERYDVLALPIVDDLGRIRGVVTHDDVLDVATEEATEDIFKAAGFSFSDVEVSRSSAILESSIAQILRIRLPWLFLALVGGMIAGGVIEAYEDTLAGVVALAFFIPVIMDMGGNVGTQASTIFVRGLAVGQIDDRNAMKHFAREGVVGLLIGLIIGGIGALGAYAWQGMLRGEEYAATLAFVVFVGLVSVCLVASVIGYVIPWLMHKTNFDPAAASDPLITTVKDVTALLIYFGLAALLLGHLL